MKNWSTYIFLLVAGALSLLATSCSQDEEHLQKLIAGEGKTIVEFSIALGNTGNSSRATWNDTYNPDGTFVGEGIDNTINLNQFFVNLKLSNSIIPIRLIRILNSSTDKVVYTFKGEVEVRSVQSLKGAKIEVYTNIGESQTSFSTNYTRYPETGVQYIPMWGVHTITDDNLLLEPSSTIQLNTPSTPVYLLRSMAKIELTLTDALINEGYNINGVTINNYNSIGNLLPTGEFGYTKLYNREDCINVSSAQYSDDGLAFYKVSDNRYWIYVPEFLINTTDEIQANEDLHITLDLYKGNEKFPEDRSTFSMFETSLVRNHWYKYTITSANMEEDVFFNLNYKVINWQDIDNGTLNFGDHNGNVN